MMNTTKRGSYSSNYDGKDTRYQKKKNGKKKKSERSMLPMCTSPPTHYYEKSKRKTKTEQMVIFVQLAVRCRYVLPQLGAEHFKEFFEGFTTYLTTGILPNRYALLKAEVSNFNHKALYPVPTSVPIRRERLQYLFATYGRFSPALYKGLQLALGLEVKEFEPYEEDRMKAIFDMASQFFPQQQQNKLKLKTGFKIVKTKEEKVIRIDMKDIERQAAENLITLLRKTRIVDLMIPPSQTIQLNNKQKKAVNYYFRSRGCVININEIRVTFPTQIRPQMFKNNDDCPIGSFTWYQKIRAYVGYALNSGVRTSKAPNNFITNAIDFVTNVVKSVYEQVKDVLIKLFVSDSLVKYIVIIVLVSAMAMVGISGLIMATYSISRLLFPTFSEGIERQNGSLIEWFNKFTESFFGISGPWLMAKTFFRDITTTSRGLESMSKITTFITSLLRYMYKMLVGKNFFTEDDIDDECRAHIATLQSHVDTYKIEEVDEWLRAYTELVRLTPRITHRDISMSVQAQVRASNARFIELMNVKTHVDRPRPACVLFRGSSAVGKSFLSGILARLLYESDIKYKRDHPKAVYDRNPSDQYWSGYAGHFATLFDDFLQVKDEALRGIQSLELIHCVNNAAFSLNMAGIADKGCTPFVSKLVLLTTNENKFENLGIQHAEALENRITLDITVKRKITNLVPEKITSKVVTTADIDRCYLMTLKTYSEAENKFKYIEITAKDLLTTLKAYIDRAPDPSQFKFIPTFDGKVLPVNADEQCNRVRAATIVRNMRRASSDDSVLDSEQILTDIDRRKAELAKIKEKVNKMLILTEDEEILLTKRDELPDNDISVSEKQETKLSFTDKASGEERGYSLGISEESESESNVDHDEIDGETFNLRTLHVDGHEVGLAPKRIAGTNFCPVGKPVINLALTKVQFQHCYLYYPWIESLPKQQGFDYNFEVKEPISVPILLKKKHAGLYMVNEFGMDHPATDSSGTMEYECPSIIPYVQRYAWWKQGGHKFTYYQRSQVKNQIFKILSALSEPTKPFYYCRFSCFTDFEFHVILGFLLSNVFERSWITDEAAPDGNFKLMRVFTYYAKGTTFPYIYVDKNPAIKTQYNRLVVAYRDEFNRDAFFNPEMIDTIRSYPFIYEIVKGIGIGLVIYAAIVAVRTAIKYVVKITKTSLEGICPQSDDKLMKYHQKRILGRKYPRGTDWTRDIVKQNGSEKELRIVKNYRMLSTFDPQGNGIGFVHALFLTGNTCLTSRHILEDDIGTIAVSPIFGNPEDSAYFEMADIKHSKGLEVDLMDNGLRSRDLIFITFPSYPRLKDISSMLRTRKGATNPIKTKKLVVYNKSIVDYGYRDSTLMEGYMNMPIGLEEMYAMHVEGSKGECGYVYVSESKSHEGSIIYSHIAGSTAVSVGAPIYSEDLEAYLKQKEIDVNLVTRQAGGSPQFDGRYKLCLKDKLIPSIDVGLPYLGEIDKVSSQPIHTEFVPSVLQTEPFVMNNDGKLELKPFPVPVDTAPAALNGDDIFVNGFKKYHREVKAPYFPELRDPDAFSGVFKSGGITSFRFLSVSEALKGTEKLVDLDPTKSSGPILTHYSIKRSDVVMDGSLREDVEEYRNQLENEWGSGIPRPIVVEACKKDEIRPGEKVAARLTRLFFISLLWVNVLLKQLFGSFSEQINGSLVSDIAIGHNPYFSDTHVLYRLLRRTGKFVDACDTSGWDQTFYPWFGEIFGNYLYTHCLFIPLRYRIMMKTCLEVLFNPIVIVRKDVFQAFGLMSSGLWVTALLNSIMHSWKVRVMWKIYCTEMKIDLPFDAVNTLRVHGDDKVHSFVKAITFRSIPYNLSSWGSSLMSIMSKEIFSQNSTNCFKDGPPEDYQLEDVEFLKRRFRVKGNKVYAPLNIGSIYRMVLWIRKPKDGDRIGQFISNVHVAAREMWFHGKEPYDEFCALMNPYLAVFSARKACIIETYAERARYFECELH